MQRLILWSVSCLVGIAALYGVWRFWTYDTHFFRAAAGTLAGELAAAKTEGVPLEIEDLRPNPPVPDDQNAGLIYQDAMGEAKDAFGDALMPYELLEAWVVTPTAANLARADKRLKELSSLIAKLHRAALLPRCDFHHAYELSADMVLPEYAFLKSAARTLAFKARIDVAKGRDGEALRSLGAALRLAAHAGEEPLVMAALVQMACEEVALRAISSLASASVGRPDLLAKLEDLLASCSPLPALSHSLTGEPVSARIAVRKYTWRDLASVYGMAEEELARQQAIRVDEELRKDAYDARVVSYYRKVWPLVRRYKLGAPATFDSQTASLKAAGKTDPTYAFAILATFMGFDIAATSLGRAQVRRDLAALKIRLLRHREYRGGFPLSLKDIGKEPLDIFTGKPIQYRLRAGGFLIYSFGANRTDDAGVYEMRTHRDDVSLEHPIAAGRRP